MTSKYNDPDLLAVWASESDNYAKRDAQQLQEGVWITPHIISILKQSHVSPKRVLEVGCSHGHNLRTLFERFGCEASGVESGQEVLEVGKRTFPFINFRQEYAHSLSFEDDHFDLAMAIDVFSWIPRNYYLGSVPNSCV